MPEVPVPSRAALTPREVHEGLAQNRVCGRKLSCGPCYKPRPSCPVKCTVGQAPSHTRRQAARRRGWSCSQRCSPSEAQHDAGREDVTRRTW